MKRTGGGQVKERWRIGRGQMEDRWRTGGGQLEDRWRICGGQVVDSLALRQHCLIDTLSVDKKAVCSQSMLEDIDLAGPFEDAGVSRLDISQDPAVVLGFLEIGEGGRESEVHLLGQLLVLVPERHSMQTKGNSVYGFESRPSPAVFHKSTTLN